MRAVRYLIAMTAFVWGVPHAAAQSPDSTGMGTGPFFVMTGSFTSKPAAQEYAYHNGGWVLRTNLYSALTPGFFAVVHGPFDARADADRALNAIKVSQPQAYVRQGGYPYLLPELGDPGLLAAFLGLVQMREVDDVSACAPREEHMTVALLIPASPGRPEVEVGRLWLMEQTGQVIPIRPCSP